MTGADRRIVIRAHGGPEVLALESVEPGLPGPGEVRIRHEAIGVNFIDVYYRTGLYPAPLPHGLGFEAAGVVEAVGPGVTELAPGDRVAYAQGPIGAYATARVLPAETVVRLPDEVTGTEAAALLLKGLTVQYLFRQLYVLQPGQTILFHAAAGGVGLLACQWARALGVRLIGTVSTPEKAALAEAHGAWATVPSSATDLPERVRALTDGAMVPVVYDSVGRDTWLASLDCLAPRGLMVSFGNASGPVTGVDLGLLARKGSLFVTRPALGTYVTPRPRLEAAAAELFAMVATGRIRATIGHRWPLAEAAAAHAALESRRTTGAILLEP